MSIYLSTLSGSSLAGQIGATGPQGASGSTGIDGASGPIGLTGATGIGIVAASTWTITESSGNLYFAVSGVNKMKIDSTGAVTVADNITAYGTI